MTTTEKSIGLIWVDIETTGLDPDTDLLLELSFICTEYDGARHGTVGSSGTFLIKHKRESDLALLGATAFSDRSPAVREMHHKSGLWRDLEAGDRNAQGNPYVSSGYAVAALNAAIKAMRESFDEVRMAGSSVHFDQQFLHAISGRYHAETQRTAGLSHRTHDMTAMRSLCEALGFGYFQTQMGTAHRAEDDITGDLASWVEMFDDLYTSLSDPEKSGE